MAPYNKSTGRDYSYDTKYQSSPLQKKRRAARNAARAIMEKKGLVKPGDGKDVDHKNRSMGKNLSNAPGNIRVQSRKKNRARN